MKEINNYLMEITKKIFTVKTVIVFLICLVLLFLFSSWMKNHSTDNISKNRQQEILKFKNNISEEILLNCNIETWKCEFNIQNSEIKEMAEYLKSSQAVYSTGHNIPYASINFTENKTDNYFKINVGFYNLLNMKGCAVFRLSLYNNDKEVAADYFSSRELIDWCINQFPDIFERIQRENEKYFYRKTD